MNCSVTAGLIAVNAAVCNTVDVSPSDVISGKSINTQKNIIPTSANGRTRRISSSALYEIWRKDLKDVCYLYVPDEYDLVKSHLMFAVREEVEVLKEKISELMERITQLEYENTILRANATPETLAQLQKSAQHPAPNASEGHQGFS